MMARFSSHLTRSKRSRVGGYSLTKHSGSTYKYSVKGQVSNKRISYRTAIKSYMASGMGLSAISLNPLAFVSL